MNCIWAEDPARVDESSINDPPGRKGTLFFGRYFKENGDANL